ncbi:hypothetical protein BGZ58_001746 [Dissophora ornata]|nr:hypothetical protein BGZ58_001746 [Dissophora ornata]
MPQEKLDAIVKDEWCNFVLEEKLVIQPHEGAAQVQVSLCNNDNTERHEYSGLAVEHVEIRPIDKNAVTNTASFCEIAVTRACVPDFVIDSSIALPVAQNATNTLPAAPITRISASKGSRFLASLALSLDAAYITVYDMSIVSTTTDAQNEATNARTGYAVAVVEHPGIGNLPIGLALSTNGDQVAIFQEPKIGQWADESTVQRASFPFKLFNNPLVPPVSVVLNMNTVSSNNINGNATSPTNNTLASGSNPGNNIGQTPVPTSVVRMMQEAHCGHDILHVFIGYGKFLRGLRLKDALKRSSQKSSFFVACNGLYIDVFKISPDKKWDRNHTIQLTYLLPTFSRRLTCKMMMDSVSTTAMIFLENGGLCSTIWNLHTGFNHTYISCNEDNSYVDGNLRYSKAALSRDESIAALTSIGGSVTTHFLKTGIPISHRTFPGTKIEYLGFYGCNDQLFVITRDNITSELKAMILDPMHLSYEIPVNKVPVPIIGSAICADFCIKGFWNSGVICEADTSKINCYSSHTPGNPRVIKNNQTVVRAKPTDVVCRSTFDKDIKYRLQTEFRREFLQEDASVVHWVCHVELIEENLTAMTQRTVISFVAEPWMRVWTAKIVNPEVLMSAFFLPCGTRFAVVGVQSLQIWNLPTSSDTKCSLQFIWSQRRGDSDCKSGHVRDHYLNITSISIYFDSGTSDTFAEIKVGDKAKKRTISIPGPGTLGADRAIRPCVQSVHLLAAAYVFSIHECKKTSEPPEALIYDDHAQAILHFARRHINYLLPAPVNVLPKKNLESPDRRKTESVLELLLGLPSLQTANFDFVDGLINSEDASWIPNKDHHWNPIKRVIRGGDGRLVKVFTDYCIEKAKKIHPGYLIPVVECMEELADRYPSILVDLFRRTSYVPAPAHSYVPNYAIIANQHKKWKIRILLLFWVVPLLGVPLIICLAALGKTAAISNNFNGHKKPVFSLRNRIPIQSYGLHLEFRTKINRFGRRHGSFPSAPDVADEKTNGYSRYSHKVYVCPLPKMSWHGYYRMWDKDRHFAKSSFAKIAGKDFFDSPAMAATLKFKWCVNALRRLYQVRFISNAVLSPPLGTNSAPFSGFAEYMQRVAEILQFWDSPRKYLSSPYNYINLVAYILPTAACSELLFKVPDGSGTGSGPEGLWVMSFAILAVYLNLLFEFRVFKELGILVNIIINITRRIKWFFIIFGVFIIAFTNALLYVLHARGGNDSLEHPDGYPTDFLSALSVTYFFIAGRFDPVSSSLMDGSASFIIIMMMFFFVTTILLLNILIALMNDAFNESKQEGKLAWLKQLSDVIAEIEVIYMSPDMRANPDWFPDYIYYGASEQEAELYESQYTITNKSELSVENQFLLEAVSGEQSVPAGVQKTILNDVRTLTSKLEEMELAREAHNKDMDEMKALQEQSNMELTEIKKLITALIATQSNKSGGGIASSEGGQTS